jgi:2-C-methyl-D-erythritol 4-phosphate cytidylyltransferase
MSLFGKKPPPPFVSAVVAAAGASSRMEGLDKQMAEIGGLPVIVRCIEALSISGYVSEIILVCPPPLIPEYFSLVKEYGLPLVASVVGGGETRQESVFAGVKACSGEAHYYVIHDGARPLIEPELIGDCVWAATIHGAAALGVPPKDTIKRMDSRGFVADTLPRQGLICIQTPQAFGAGLYKEAMERARRNGQDFTDDCQLIESLGHKVYVVPGSFENIKITTPEDIAVAGAVLRQREGLLCE